MKYAHRTLALATMLGMIIFAGSGNAEERTGPQPPQGFIALFNGVDLSGWKGLVENPKKRATMSVQELTLAQEVADRKMHEHWKVIDGALEFDGSGRNTTLNLCTATEYGDFELFVDWKLLEAGDSGIYLRGSPQLQIWDTDFEDYWKNGADKGSGALWNNRKNARFPLAKADKPVGEWNTFHIRMVGEKVTVKLNGQLVVDDTVMENFWERRKPIYSRGSIELQNHSNLIWFRNIYLREIPGKADTSIGDIAGEPKPIVEKSRPGLDSPLPRIPPTDADVAAKTIRLQNGFRAELVAAEPLVTDPIAIQYDENGLAYVIEMNDYPYSDKSHDQAWELQKSEPIGRVRLLEDTDGDGTFDKATVFADKLSWPAGIALWKGGVYVAATPDVWYFKDTDGDGRADIRRKVFTGFRKYNVQAVMNNFQWGLDHRIYAAGSSNGGNVSSVNQTSNLSDGADEHSTGDPTRIGRNDFRFDPRTEVFEVISGGARFGQTRDDWGNRFLCNIRNPVQHVVLPARYLRRNPFLPVKSAVNDVAKSGDAIAVFQISPAEPWRAINARRLAANTVTTSPHDSTVEKGFVTSSSGVTIYRGAAYPEEFYGNAFIGEVAGNLVMRYRLATSGVSFEGTRAHDKVEFLASTDNWFRPVNFANAPDGTLHLLDMYRETIEHPWSMPDDLKARVDLTSGRDRGRIYRLVPPTYRAGFQKPPPPRLGSASSSQLVAELENPNSWWRETAHRLIFERQDRAAETPLRSLLRESQSSVARLHALWSLSGLQALSVDDLKVALADSDPHLREHAVRLAEPRLKDAPGLLQSVLAIASDDSIRVRFQVALTLGEVDDQQATRALAAIARRDADDPWSRTAVLSSLSSSGVPFLLQVLADADFAASDPGHEMIGQLAFGVGAGNDTDDVDRVLLAVERSSTRLQHTVVMNIGAGVKQSKRDLTQIAADDSKPGSRLVARLLDESRRKAVAADGDVQQRLEAIELLSYSRFDSVRETLSNLLDARQPQEIQSAAINAMTGFPNPEVADILLGKHAALTPPVQANLVNRLLTRREWLVAVFDAIEKRAVPASRVSPVRQTIYMKSSNSAIREQAIRLFSGNLPGPRKDVIAQYQSALTLESAPSRGQIVFKRECLNCHRLGTQGHDVGPNLATIRNRTPAQLLVNLLDPNREVSPNYLQYIVVTLNGRVATGIVASETPASITLRQAEGKQQTILRRDIDEFTSSGQSMMPEGLEKTITPQDMADLIAYLLYSKQN